jgi:CheY-like chemotaxis protein
MTDEVGMARKVVVIVEDHALTRSTLERVVAREFAPITCASFEQAMRLLDELDEPPVALIVDVNLGAGRGDGLDIAQRARERFGCRIPTLVLTGTMLPEITERAQELRGEFLAKPQTADALRRFLQRARTQQDWGVADVVALDRAIDEFARLHVLTDRQRKLLHVLMRAAERGERPQLNANTRKAGMRRLLARSGHASFDEVRAAIKQHALRLA